MTDFEIGDFVFKHSRNDYPHNRLAYAILTGSKGRYIKPTWKRRFSRALKILIEPREYIPPHAP